MVLILPKKRDKEIFNTVRIVFDFIPDLDWKEVLNVLFVYGCDQILI